MTPVSVLYVAPNAGFARKVASALERAGYQPLLNDGSTVELQGEATIIVWSGLSISSDAFKRAAQAAMETGRAAPVSIGKIEPPAAFRKLRPIDLARWDGGDGDPRWRFVVDELALILGAHAAPPTVPSPEPTGDIGAEIMAGEIDPAVAASEPARPRLAFPPALLFSAAAAALFVLGAALFMMSWGEPAGRDDQTETAIALQEAEEEEADAAEPVIAMIDLVETDESGDDRKPDTPGADDLRKVEPFAATAEGGERMELEAAEPADPAISPPSIKTAAAEAQGDADFTDIDPKFGEPGAAAAGDIEAPADPPLFEQPPADLGREEQRAEERPDEEALLGSPDEPEAEAPYLIAAATPEPDSALPAPASRALNEADPIDAWLMARGRQGEAQHGYAGNYFKECPSCPDMAALPARNGAGRFAIATREVTSAQWHACVRDGACEGAPPEAGRRESGMPVTFVSWVEAKAYADWLSAKTGARYRLPTEEEWVYAAIADSGEPDGSRGGSKRAAEPNAFGIFNMRGNVAEWTADCVATGRDGCDARLIRGGSWRDERPAPGEALSSTAEEDASNDALGFRVARDLP